VKDGLVTEIAETFTIFGLAKGVPAEWMSKRGRSNFWDK
jgi:hypothetical protein